MPLKVMHIIGGGEFGGAERHILNLAGAVDPKAVEITVCCLFNAPFAEIASSAGINTTVLPMRHRLDFGVVGKLAGLIKERDVDLIHTHGVRANLLGRLAARHAGTKQVVTTVHSLLERDYPGLFLRCANCWAERATWGWTDRFITVSGGLKEKLVSRGVPEDKITIIYNGIVEEEFSPPEVTGAYRKKLGFRAQTPLIGIVARLHEVKGHRYFLEAAREVLSKRSEVKFLIVGDGPYRNHLEDMARRLRLTGQVIFTGFEEDVRTLIADLDLLVIASLWEGFGLTAVEAMALKVPVVATEVGGLPEVVLHGETGLLVPPSNSSALAKGILWMLEHPEASAEMVMKGREAVLQKYTAAVMAHRTEELYRRVAGSVRC